MKSTSERLLTLLNILAWIVCMGIITRAGSVIISYVVSIGNPEAAKDLYMGLDLSVYRDQSFWDYTFLVVCKVILYVTQAYIFFLITRLSDRLKISSSLNADAGIRKVMKNISYSIIAASLVAIVYNFHSGIFEGVMIFLQQS